MDVLNLCEEEIWENSPFRNHQLRLKIRKVAHKQTRTVLVALRRKAEIGSDDYLGMYTKVFKALVTKRIASGKTDSRASTPSVTNWEDYTEHDEDMIQLKLKREPEEAQVPQPSHGPSSVSFADPLIADAVAQMYAPQQQGESAGEYHHRRDAAIRLHNVALEGTPTHHDTNQPSLTEDLESAHLAARRTSKVPTPATQARCEVRVPMADQRKDRIAYQHLRNEDMEMRGSSLYDDQGIIFDGHRPIDMKDPRYTQPTSQAPAPDDPHGSDSEPDDRSNRSRRRPQENPRIPCHPNSDHNPHGGAGGGGGGDGGPPNGGGGFDPGGDDPDPPTNRRPLHRGYSMPPADRAKLHTPGVRATNEHHRAQMHDRLLRLCCEHLLRVLKFT